MSPLDALTPFLSGPNLMRVLGVVLLLLLAVLLWVLYCKQVQSNTVLLNYKSTIEQLGTQVIQLSRVMGQIIPALSMAAPPSVDPLPYQGHHDGVDAVGTVVYIGHAKCPHSRQFNTTWNTILQDPQRRPDIDYMAFYEGARETPRSINPVQSKLDGVGVPAIITILKATGEEKILSGNRPREEVVQFIADAFQPHHAV
jgi:hypothetical protein